MSETAYEMQPVTALGGREPRVETHEGVTLREVTDLALASYTARLGQETAAAQNLASFMGTELPGPGKMTQGTLSSFWMGPDQWMVIAPHETHETLVVQLVTATTGTASITEQNDAWCCFELTGPRLVTVFELLCPVHLRACSGGEATRTSIDHLGCFLLVEGPETVRVLGPRSSAGSLHHALLTAMRAAL